MFCVVALNQIPGNGTGIPPGDTSVGCQPLGLVARFSDFFTSGKSIWITFVRETDFLQDDADCRAVETALTPDFDRFDLWTFPLLNALEMRMNSVGELTGNEPVTK